MCCFKRPKNIERKYKKRRSTIHPAPQKGNIRERRNAVDAEFMDKFIREVIYCGGCKEPFNLDSNELKIHCIPCTQFFHCKIAGKCQGENCKIINEDNTIHRASYCYDCIGILSDNKILCKDCFKEYN